MFHQCSSNLSCLFTIPVHVFTLPLPVTSTYFLLVSVSLVGKGLEIHGLLRVAFLSAGYTGYSIMEWRPVNVVPVHHVWHGHFHLREA